MKQYVVDAFTDHVFAGNPAAVCVMDKWLDEKTMMAITMENNLSETAFAVKEGEKYHLRWFTPRRRDRPVRSCYAGHCLRHYDLRCPRTARGYLHHAFR